MLAETGKSFISGVRPSVRASVRPARFVPVSARFSECLRHFRPYCGISRKFTHEVDLKRVSSRYVQHFLHLDSILCAMHTTFALCVFAFQFDSVWPWLSHLHPILFAIRGTFVLCAFAPYVCKMAWQFSNVSCHSRLASQHAPARDVCVFRMNWVNFTP